MASILIHDAGIVTVDDAFTIHERGWIQVEGQLIVGVGAGDPPTSATTDKATVIDGTGHCIMPGMVNGHTHLFQTFFRGLGDDKSLLDWLRDYIWPAASLMTAEEAGVAAMVGLMENLRSGATSVMDHQYIHPDDEFDNAVCAAAEKLGVRFLLARGWADRNYEPRLQETPEQIRTRTDKVRERWQNAANGRIRVELAPLIPWGCSDETMKSTVEQSRSWNGGTHIHCAETKVEVDMSLEERGMRHVPWLDSLGVLGPDTQLVHSVWLDDAELDIIAARGASVVHCPTSNMYLASGVARVPEMLARGIPVALASDGPGSNNRQDMFEALKTSVLLQKVHHLDPVIMQPEQALQMACRGGAIAMGLSKSIGSIEAGKLADLVMVDLRSPFVAPVHRLASALVFNVTPRDVRHVIVDGEFVIRDGSLMNSDEQQVLAAAEVACDQLFRRAGLR
jgi:5-methylthioadenosine/S-adenosylhomocysteine deaminase